MLNEYAKSLDQDGKQRIKIVTPTNQPFEFD
jgi:hypothetical protein